MKSIIKIKDKKALSEVVAVLSLILISLAAISILWIIVKNLTNPEILLAPKQCLDMQINPPYSIEKACYNETSKEAVIILKKTMQNYQINNLYFIMNSVEESLKWRCGSQCQNCKLPITQTPKDFFISLNNKPNSVTLQINDCAIETKGVIEC